MTAKLAVVGDPIAHSKSPELHAAFAAQTGQSLTYNKAHVSRENLLPFLDDFFSSGGTGLNLTVPHKEAAFQWAPKLTPAATQAGAINTLFFDAEGQLTGDNTDGAGLVDDLRRQGMAIAGRRVLVLGAGGAARGALGPLLNENPSTLSLHNRTTEKAEALAQQMGVRLVSADEGPFDLIISTTSAGLSGEPMSLPQYWVGPETMAYDMIYADNTTPFIQAAQSLGARQTSDGFGMLVGQAARAFERWFGVLPETESVIQRFR